MSDRPQIVCMCGSTRFKQTWIVENARLTSEGYIVLAVGIWGHHERRFPSPEEKATLDELHKRKIDLANWVWVLDVGGYIGESTQSEISYARYLGKPVRYLSKEFPDYQEPVDELIDAHEQLDRAGIRNEGLMVGTRIELLAHQLEKARTKLATHERWCTRMEPPTEWVD